MTVESSPVHDARRDPKRGVGFVVLWTLIGGLMLALAAGTVGYFIEVNRNVLLDQRVDNRDGLVDDWEARYESLLEDYTTLANECAMSEDCQQSTPSPAVIERVTERVVGERGAAGVPGAPGRDGVDGEDGHSPSGPQVLDAVRNYCFMVNGCVGPRGEVGQAGTNGVDGAQGPQGARGDSVTGPQGPAGADGAQGPQGAPGEPGPAGAPGANGVNGRGVSSVTCEGAGSDSYWIMSFTDNTSQIVPGPCRLGLL